MVKTSFAKTWKGSTSPGKQRKFRYNAPLHVRQKLMGTHLSPELRKKYGLRSIQVKKGDKVKIMRGKFRKKEGKVDLVNIKLEKVYVNGIEQIKKEGAKIGIPLNPSNLMIMELDLKDRKRKSKLERNSKSAKEEPKEKVVENNEKEMENKK